MPKTRHLALGLTLAATVVGSAAWAAATAEGAPAAAASPAAVGPAHAATRHHAATRSLVARHRAAGHAPGPLDAMHRHVALMRAAEQRRWIHAGVRTHELDRAQATNLQAAVREIVGEQSRLTRRGHETVNEALNVSHRQDVLDWAIRTGHAEFEPALLHDAA